MEQEFEDQYQTIENDDNLINGEKLIEHDSFIRNFFTDLKETLTDSQSKKYYIITFIAIIILIISIFIIRKILKRKNSDKYVQKVASLRQNSMTTPSNSVFMGNESLQSSRSVSWISKSISSQSMPRVKSSSNLLITSEQFQNTEIHDFEKSYVNYKQSGNAVDSSYFETNSIEEPEILDNNNDNNNNKDKSD